MSNLCLLATLTICAFSNSSISTDVSSTLRQSEKIRSTDHFGSPVAAGQGVFFPSCISFLPEGNVLLHRPCIQSTFLDAPMLAGCPKARLMLSSQVWVPTIFILGLAVMMPWYFAAGPVPLAQDLAPLLNKGVTQRCRSRLCPVCPGDFWKKPTLSFAKKLI